jgi:hypothetical protein
MDNVCFTILVLPVLLDEEYWSFQYHVFYNTSITSIVGWRILELPLLCINQRFWYSSIVNARYWYIQYCIYTILDFRYCNITMLVFLVQYCKYYNTGITGIAAGCFILSLEPLAMACQLLIWRQTLTNENRYKIKIAL